MYEYDTLIEEKITLCLTFCKIYIKIEKVNLNILNLSYTVLYFLTLITYSLFIYKLIS